MKRLIINADDLGYDPAVTRGILEAMEQGVVSSTTFMVNGPSSQEAGGLVRGKGLAIGLHLNLARWRPAWVGFPGALLEQGELSEARAAALPPEVVEKEALAQLDKLWALVGAQATHVDVHKHLHRHPGVMVGVLAAARARNLPLRTLDADMRKAARKAGVATTDAFIGDAGAEPYWTPERASQELASLPDGLTELMCHPGYAPTTLKSGYGAQRETELATFKDAAIRGQLAAQGVQVETFRALAS